MLTNKIENSQLNSVREGPFFATGCMYSFLLLSNTNYVPLLNNTPLALPSPTHSSSLLESCHDDLWKRRKSFAFNFQPKLQGWPCIVMHGGREGGTVYWISFYADIPKESKKWYGDGFHGMSIEWRNTKRVFPTFDIVCLV